jgi:hypothetical protein
MALNLWGGAGATPVLLYSALYCLVSQRLSGLCSVFTLLCHSFRVERAPRGTSTSEYNALHADGPDRSTYREQDLS